MDEHDRWENKRSLKHGWRILSFYPAGGKTVFTDLVNPTSNRIYQDIGCNAVCDVDVFMIVARD